MTFVIQIGVVCYPIVSIAYSACIHDVSMLYSAVYSQLDTCDGYMWIHVDTRGLDTMSDTQRIHGGYMADTHSDTKLDTHPRPVSNAFGYIGYTRIHTNGYRFLGRCERIVRRCEWESAVGVRRFRIWFWVYGGAVGMVWRSQ